MKELKTYTNTDTKEESTLWINSDNSAGTVERIIDNGSDAIHTGVWFHGKTLVDYDGVFNIHIDTIKCLRLNGFIVPREYEVDCAK